MKRVFFIQFISILIITCCRGESSVNMEAFEKALYKLGSYPVSKLDEKYRSTHNDPGIYLKGERIDINGWIIPYWLHSGALLNDKERKNYGIAERQYLDYEEYISYLKSWNYKKPVDPLFYALINFVLDDFLYSEMKIKDIDVFLKIYEANIGLEAKVLTVLEGDVKADQIPAIYKKYSDEKFIRIFPVPKAHDKEYISFLHGLLNTIEDYYNKFLIHNILYSMDEKEYRDVIKKYIVENIYHIKQWNHRSRLCDILIHIKDEGSINFLSKFLLTEKSQAGIEYIISKLTIHKIISQPLINSTLTLYTRNDEYEEDKLLSQMPGRFHYHLKKYLLLALEDQMIDDKTKARINNL